jgi:hypothetical protein
MFHGADEVPGSLDLEPSADGTALTGAGAALDLGANAERIRLTMTTATGSDAGSTPAPEIARRYARGRA